MGHSEAGPVVHFFRALRVVEHHNLAEVDLVTRSPLSKSIRRRVKAVLPEKICVTCGRPFTWRKKWARDWTSARYCSERCRRAKASRAGEAS